MADDNSRTYDAASTQTAILDAAEATFAEQGFAGARVDAIAAAAGYNKSLIYQYFGDKLRLYAAVLQRANAEANALQARVFAPLLADSTLAEDAQRLRPFFTDAFTAVFDHLLARPRLLQILMWEMASGWQTYSQISSQTLSAQPRQLEALFQRAQQAGVIRSAYTPTIQLTIALQLCQTFLASQPFYQLLLPTADLTTATALDQSRKYIVSLIVAGLMPDPA